MARTRCYQDGVLVAEDFPLADVSEHLDLPEAVVWVDLYLPDIDELHVLADELGLHKLAVEDAVHLHERPKLDRYPDHNFLSCYAVNYDQATIELAKSEVAALFTEHALVTVRKDESFDIDEVVARWDAEADLAKYGIAFLVHGLLDYVVDTHYEAVQALDEQIESLEDALFATSGSREAIQRQTFRLRKNLVWLRRVVLPMREVVNTLLRRDLNLVGDAMGPYFQDVYDHVLRASEWTESLRDLISNVLETNLTIQGNRLGIITKKVTGWAAIIAVPTAVTGFYGQNVPYPGFAHTSGFYASSAVIIICSVALYLIFRTKDWL